jgi:uncharacterized membrane protein
MESPDFPAEHQSSQSQGEADHAVIASFAEVSVGPLPPPHVLQGYNEIVPGAADRILQMAERQSDHRMEMERAVVNGDSKRSYLGLIAAFVLSAGIIGGGLFIIALGHQWPGVLLIGVNVVSLAGVFIYGSKNRREQQQAIMAATLNQEPPE